jgi:hypothetical protein
MISFNAKHRYTLKLLPILLLIYMVLLVTNANCEESPQNITVVMHRSLEFISETDAIVTDTYTTNDDISIDGTEKFLPWSDVFDYSVSADGTIVASIYNPTYKPLITITNDSGIFTVRVGSNKTMVKDTVLMVPRIQLDRNKTITAEFTVLNIAKPIEPFGIPLDKKFFPLDGYVYILDTPLRDYKLNYSSEIDFPISFDLLGSIVRYPYIQQSKISNSSITFVTINVRNDLITSKSIEANKLRVYMPLMVIPSDSEFMRLYNQHER